MSAFLLWALAVVAVTGLVCKFVVMPLILHAGGFGSRVLRITGGEYLVVLVISSLVIGQIVGFIGSKIAIEDKINRTEFLNGYEREAIKAPTRCYEGHSGGSASSGYSNCEHTYVSDMSLT